MTTDESRSERLRLTPNGSKPAIIHAIESPATKPRAFTARCTARFNRRQSWSIQRRAGRATMKTEAIVAVGNRVAVAACRQSCGCGVKARAKLPADKACQMPL